MFEFWYEYVKARYSETAKLCYMDTDSFIVQMKKDDFDKDLAKDIEIRFNTSN